MPQQLAFSRLTNPGVLILDGVAHLTNPEATDGFDRELLEFLASTRGSSV